MRARTVPNGSVDKHVKEIRRKTRRKEDPNCSGWSSREEFDFGALPPRGDRGKPLLQLVEGFHGSREEAAGRGYGSAGEVQRGPARSSEVNSMKRGARDLKEVVAEQTLELRLLKKQDRGWGRPRMRYPASERLEIIRLVEGSHLPVKRTLQKLGVSRPTFYSWYDRYFQRGEAGLADRKSHPGRVWNRIPDTVRQAMLEMALARPELSPRELAVTFTDEHNYFVSEASVYRLLRSHDLISSPAFIVMKAADEFLH